MSIVTDKQASKMSKEYKNNYCKWCWGHDYGDCSLCAIEPKKLLKEKDDDIK